MDSALVDHARSTGEILGRSTSAQLAHWARLGCAIEDVGLTSSHVQALLVEQRRYDDLGPDEQAAVQAQWRTQIADGITALDFEAEFRESGQAYAELSGDGEVVFHERRTEQADPPAPR